MTDLGVVRTPETRARCTLLTVFDKDALRGYQINYAQKEVMSNRRILNTFLVEGFSLFVFQGSRDVFDLYTS